MLESSSPWKSVSQCSMTTRVAAGDNTCHQKQHEALKPLHMFISGVEGTGKSFLIDTIRAKVGEIWDKSEAYTCAVAAPTGLAAFNVGGITAPNTKDRQLSTGHCQKIHKRSCVPPFAM